MKINQNLKQISQALLSQRHAIAEKVVSREFARNGEIEKRYGRIGREKCLEDALYHLSYLAEAVEVEDPGLFSDYVGWAKVMLSRRNLPVSDLRSHLAVLEEVLGEMPELTPAPCGIIEHALNQLPGFPEDPPSFIQPGPEHSLLAHQYLQALLGGRRQVASQLILDAVKRGVGVRKVYLNVFQRTQYEIGRLWQINRISVAQEHYCTAVTQLVMSQLYPLIFCGEKKGGTFLATCIAGELHEIGIRMVADFFEMSGWNTWYFGANTPSASLVQTVAERKPACLGISATISYHVSEVEALVRRLRAEPACAGVKILVGGHPFNIAPDLWRKVGADGSAHDAEAVVTLAEQLCNYDH